MNDDYLTAAGMTMIKPRSYIAGADPYLLTGTTADTTTGIIIRDSGTTTINTPTWIPYNGPGSGTSVINGFEIHRQHDWIQSIIDAIPPTGWEFMVSFSDIEDPDFLIEEFDADTITIIRCEIQRLRRKQDMREYVAKKHITEYPVTPDECVKTGSGLLDHIRTSGSTSTYAPLTDRELNDLLRAFGVK